MLAHQLAPAETNLPAARLTDARESLQQLRLTVPRHAGYADDFTRPKLESDALDSRHAQPVAHFEVCHREQCHPRRRRAFVHLQQHRPAHHFLGETARRSFLRHHLGNDRALPHDRHAVRDRHDFTELVGDQNDRLPLLAQPTEHFEKLIRLLGRQHCRRLVENQDLHPAVERFQDLDPLL